MEVCLLVGTLIGTLIAFIVFRLTNSFAPSRSDFFAAHAPEKPEWFKPVVPNQPIQPLNFEMKFGTNSDHPLRELIRRHYYEGSWSKINPEVGENSPNGWEAIAAEDYSIIPKKLKEELAAEEALWVQYYVLKKEWDQIFREEEIKQWRNTYAEIMT